MLVHGIPLSPYMTHVIPLYTVDVVAEVAEVMVEKVEEGGGNGGGGGDGDGNGGVGRGVGGRPVNGAGLGRITINPNPFKKIKI